MPFSHPWATTYVIFIPKSKPTDYVTVSCQRKPCYLECGPGTSSITWELRSNVDQAPLQFNKIAKGFIKIYKALVYPEIFIWKGI